MAKTASGLAVLRVVTIACNFLQIPFALNALGSERFGLWATISASVALLGFSDMGIGNGLQAKLGIYHGQGDKIKSTSLICSSILLLALTGFAAVMLTLIVSRTILDPVLIFGAGAKPFELEASNGLDTALICFGLAMPISSLGRIAYALQIGWVTAFLQAIAAVITLLLYYYLSRSSGNISDFIWAQSVPGLILTACAGGYAFSRAKLTPRIASFYNWGEAKSTIKLGAGYMLPQLSIMLVTSMQPIFIGRFVGLGEAGLYNVLIRIFNIATVPQSIIMGAMSPAYSSAYGSGDKVWLRSNYSRSLKLSAIIGLVGIGSAYLGVKFGILDILGQGELPQPSSLLLFGVALWTYAGIIGNVAATLLNAVGKPYGQAVYGTVFALFAVVLMRIMIPLGGSSLAPLSLVLSYALIVVPFTFKEANNCLKL